MDSLLHLGSALAALATPAGLGILLLGCVVGIFFGAVPGLSAFMAVALFVPVTYALEPAQGFRLLVGLYVGGTTGGLIASILLNIPGTPSSIATCFDGSPMAKHGQGGKAIGVGVLASTVGGMISYMIMSFMAPTLAEFSLKFSPYEYFSVTLFALTMVLVMASGKMARGLLATLIGLMLATVGRAPVTTTARYTFGLRMLYNGFPLIVVLLGVFAIKEVLSTAEEVKKNERISRIEIEKFRGFGISPREAWSYKWQMLRAALIGTGIGILPGVGASVAGMVSYVTAKRCSKRSEEYGRGCVEGVVASETANNAVVGGAFIPLLALGIPGDSITAMILGAFMIHGLTPGPLLFSTSGDIVYGIFAACIVATVMVCFVELGGVHFFIKLMDVPKHILMPIILVMCVIGAMAANNIIYDVYSLLVFGLVGYFLYKFNLSVGCFVLAYILGGYLEDYLLKALMYSTSVKPFFTRPISGTFLIITIIFIIYSVRREIRAAKAGV